ncbi:MAG: asparagine synthase (glutamine-hydrolyzing) [Sulfuricaulis sp.]|uniref:asparagine synthase (glutamine-hydrolyzing) n=1 Tax=Sulfuricaulis sp. TaxID=2003553 RepID=UPI0034A1C4ED
MCGFAGFVATGSATGAENLGAVASRMVGMMVHRGPDDAGVWQDADAGIALGHRRLAIVDLSVHGHQPMVSACGRYVIAYNGEIYNFPNLRQELETNGGAVAWRGHSDTEVMLAAITQWGLVAAVKRFVGMFAFALWDREERILHLVRDRMGEKPLYYGWMSKTFLFGSELKALRAYPGWRGEIDRNALALFMRHDYIPAPHSIYEGVSKLLPGTILSLSRDPVRDAKESCRPVAYWSVRDVAGRGMGNRYGGSSTEAVNELETLLKDSVKQQMVADVPLGAFLSGGVDSSTVVALMQAQSSRPVKTFTIGFEEEGYDEAMYANAVAHHLGTEHTELYVTPDQAMSVIPDLPQMYDEPFADSSQIPTFLLSSLARRYVTVSLSGDGGDELLAGYNRYFWGRKIWKTVGWMPRGLRRVTADILRTVTPEKWDSFFQRIPPITANVGQPRQPGDKLHKLGDILTMDGPEAMYLGLVSHWKNPSSLVIKGNEPLTVLTDPGQWPSFPEFTEHMMYWDMVTYLPDDILVKVDRAAMAVSLETRMPFLDHRLLEFGWRLPLSMKICNGQGKWLLRQVLYRYIPKELVERPKAGFGVPIDAWLRDPLKEWAESLLDEQRLRQEGFFNQGAIREKWTEHLSGRRNWQYHLWNVLMFQAWLEVQKGPG